MQLQYKCVFVYVLVLERANENIQQLSSALEQLSPDGEVVRGSNDTFFAAVAEEDKTAWSQKTQSEAGDSRLKFCAFCSAFYYIPGHVCVDSVQSSYEIFLLFVFSQPAEKSLVEAMRRNSHSCLSIRETVSFQGRMCSVELVNVKTNCQDIKLHCMFLLC